MEPGREQSNAIRNEIKELLGSLQPTAEEAATSSTEQPNVFERLKVSSRSQLGVESLVAEDVIVSKRKLGLRVLSKFAFKKRDNGSDVETLRCLANVLLLSPPSRQLFVDLGCAVSTASELANSDVEHEFLFSRLLFLVTYGTNCDFRVLIEEHNLGNTLCQNLQRHARDVQKRVEAHKVDSRSQMETLALAETLKLLFNTTYHNPGMIDSFNPALPSILALLEHEKVSKDDPLELVLGHLVNALLNLDLSANLDLLFPQHDQHMYTLKLTGLLENVITHYTLVEQDTRAPPLLSLLDKLFCVAPAGAKARFKAALLPSDAERSLPLGQSDTLSSRLLRLSTNARSPELRDLILSLMYDLSDKDPATFVANVGYGYASGFFVNHNIQTAGVIPQHNNGSGGDSGRVTEITDNDEEPGKGNGVQGQREGVNFVTGQFLANEPEKDNHEDMTEEEKLREAERLYVLFERLKATGVVNVENPVETAARSGQLDKH